MSNVVTFPGSSTGRCQVPLTTEDQHEAPQKRDWRGRVRVRSDIERHRAARNRYVQAVAWAAAAAESENLPAAQIEAAKQDLAKLHDEMEYCARTLLVVMPTDVKALIELLLYLERNFTILPQEIRHAGGSSNSLAFDLLRTVRLSLREIAKANKGSSKRAGGDSYAIVTLMPVIKISRRTVAALKPTAKPAAYYDSDLPGFGLRVRPTGAASWFVEYRPGAVEVSRNAV